MLIVIKFKKGKLYVTLVNLLALRLLQSRSARVYRKEDGEERMEYGTETGFEKKWILENWKRDEG